MAEKEKKEKKAKKPKKEAKKFPAKKMPGMFKKAYTDKKLEKKILKRLYVPSDKKEVTALFEKGANPKKPECMAMSMERQFTKAELKHFKSLAKQIKAQKSIFSLVPFVAVVAVVAGVGIAVTIFKNPITKKALIFGCQKVAGAKTEIRSVNLEIFGTSLTVNGLAVGNKNEEFKNIFEAEKIEVSFSLAQALRGRFDCRNIEVSGMQFNTDRKTSCKLPLQEIKDKVEEKENSESAFMVSLKARSDVALERLKSQTTAMLGGGTPEEIVKNLEAQLKTPVVVKETKEQSEALVSKWKSKPDEIKKQVSDFSSSVKDLQKLDPTKIKDVTELKATLEKLQKAADDSKKVQKNVSGVADEIKADSKKVQQLGENVTKAVADDKKFVQDTVGGAVDSVKNAKAILNDALETVACSMLGEYYPYAKKGLAYVEQMKASSNDTSKPKEKVKKEKKQARQRLRGTTFWYGTTKPAFLIERMFASGPNFEAKVIDISNDQDLLGKPMKGEGAFSLGKTSHTANLVVDTRKNSSAKLVTLGYSGKGFGANIDGKKVASASGVPSIEGTAAITMKGAFDFGAFEADGSIDLYPVKLTSDGLGNETVTKYYNKALASVDRIKAGYHVGFSDAKGVDFGLTGNFGEQFGKALMAAASEIGSDAKDKALAMLNDKINGSSSEALAKVKEFAGIEGDINAQNANLATVQKSLDNKKAQFESEIKKRAGSAVSGAVDKALPSGTKDASKALKKLF
ncbi:MAG: TIGR03545 family protein [Treponema sp.]|nr:TIGR03545 family protein [Candidatus Treponema equi]